MSTVEQVETGFSSRQTDTDQIAAALHMEKGARGFIQAWIAMVRKQISSGKQDRKSYGI